MDAIFSLGQWIKQRRKARDLTQDALAQRVGCSLETIRKIEADARRPSRQIAERLADQLGLVSDERVAFIQAARAELAPDQLPPPTRTVPQPPFVPAAAMPGGTVTFLFTDIEGSTRLWEQQPRAMEQALARHEALLRASIAANSGVVVKSTGDGIHAVFARATDAAHAALAAQRSLTAEAWGALGAVRVCIALHSGVTEQRDGDYFGPALNRVARLLACGHGGQILLSLATAELVREHLPPDTELRDLGTHRLKDLSRPEQIFRLVAPDLPADFPPLRTLDACPTNLPAQPTALIGREREIAEVCALLRRDDVRLVTLTGPGGTGKTRLALQAAAELLDDTRPTLLSQRETSEAPPRGYPAGWPEGDGCFPDGVFFVNLAPISDPGLVATTIAHVLGVTEIAGKPIEESLRAFLQAKRTLLLLDNFEQVLDAAPLVAGLLAAPRLKLLVTSRAVLHLYGEHEFAVPPLELPDLAHLPPAAQLTQYEAVRLFIARAQAAKADFAISNANASSVAEICDRLDGLPLAIELAAARIKLFPPEALLARLNQRLPFLTGGPRDVPARQQTIRNTIDWSYQLLQEGEQRLLARLSVFVGGCTLEAAEAVCGDQGSGIGDRGLRIGEQESGEQLPTPDLRPPTPVLDGLAALVDRSLLKQEVGAAGEPRFTMLETIREYALERLAARGEEALLRRRHTMYFLAATIAGGEPTLVGPRFMAGQGLTAELDNLRAALRWALDEREAETAQRLSAAVFAFDRDFTNLSEVRAWLEAALALSPPDTASPTSRDARAGALDAAGQAAVSAGDYERAHASFTARLAVCQELGDQARIAQTQRMLGHVALLRGDLVDAQTWVAQSLALCREARDPEGIAWSLYDAGHLAFMQGELAQAEGLLTESLPLFRSQGLPLGVIRALLSLGHVAHAQGQLARATTWYRESIALQLSHSKHPSGYTAEGLEGLAGVVGAQGHMEYAARLFGAAEALRETKGLPRPPVDRAAYERDLAAVRAQLDDATFDAEWEAGRAMTLEQAIACALSEGD